jgi:hypothetical protein
MYCSAKANACKDVDKYKIRVPVAVFLFIADMIEYKRDLYVTLTIERRGKCPVDSKSSLKEQERS